MRARVLLFAVTILVAVAPSTRATQRCWFQATIYKLGGVNLVPDGTLQPFSVPRSKSVEVSDILKEAFPGTPLSLLTFPTMGMPIGKRQGLGFEGLGSMMFFLADGAMPQVVIDEVTMEGTIYPALTATLSPGGGSVYFVLGGKGKSFIVCLDAFSATRWETRDDEP
jgi:hypothetical protein